MSSPDNVLSPSSDELESIASDFFETRRYYPSDDFPVDADGLPIVDDSEDNSTDDTNPNSEAESAG